MCDNQTFDWKTQIKFQINYDEPKLKLIWFIKYIFLRNVLVDKQLI